MTTPVAASPHPTQPKGALYALGATPAARQSRFRGVCWIVESVAVSLWLLKLC
jgi:hypothetical protein